jgi:MFS family permease
MVGQRFGLPHLRGASSFVLATFIDFLGTGLFLPFSLLYFTRVVGLSLSTVGLALSLATIITVPMVPLSGMLVDRFGAKLVVVAAELLQAVGVLGYLLVHQVTLLVSMALLVAAGGSLFWSAHFALVADLAASEERDRWYGLAAATRNTGLGLGGLLAGILVGLNAAVGYHLVVVANGVSFLLAAGLLLLGVRGASSKPRERRPEAAYRLVLLDRPFLWLASVNVTFALCSTLLTVGVPVYIAEALHAPLWMIGVLLAWSTLLIATLQTVVVRLLEPFRRTRELLVSGVLWGSWCVLLGLALVVPSGLLLPLLMVATGLYALGELMHDPTSNALVAETSPEPLRGRYLAIFQLSWSLATIVAPGLFTLLFTVHPVVPWLVMAGLILVASLLLLWIEPHLPPSAVRLRASATVGGAAASSRT